MLVIPKSFHGEMKKSVHDTSHLGEEICLHHAHKCIFWPGMSAEIKHYVSMCEICHSFETCQQKETLMPHEVPSRPWEKVGIDLFTLKGLNYLVIVDYYSNFIEVNHLENTDTKTVIRKLKLQFARHGLPCQLVSDNGSQLLS